MEISITKTYDLFLKMLLDKVDNWFMWRNMGTLFQITVWNNDIKSHRNLEAEIMLSKGLGDNVPSGWKLWTGGGLSANSEIKKIHQPMKYACYFVVFFFFIIIFIIALFLSTLLLLMHGHWIHIMGWHMKQGELTAFNVYWVGVSL